MNNKQYNNVIEKTAKLSETDLNDNLSLTRDTLNNMGVPLPQGELKEVSEILSTNDYMYWRACTAEEAQQFANKGIATIAVGDTDIMVVAAIDSDEGIGATAYSERSVCMEADQYNYYTYCASSSTSIDQSDTTSATTTIYPPIETHEEIFYFNNKEHGMYLRKLLDDIEAKSGTLDELVRTTIQWELTHYDSYYTIKSSDGSNKYLAVPNINDSDEVILMTVDSIVPDTCKWRIRGALGGGTTICNVFNNRYLAYHNNKLRTLDSTGPSQTSYYYECVWRYINVSRYDDSTSNAQFKELTNTFSFDCSDFAVGDTITPRYSNSLSNELWVNVSDFIFTAPTNYVKCDNFNHTLTALKSGTVPINVRHKVTGIKKNFTITINKTAIIIIPGIMGSKLKTTAKYGVNNAGDQLWPPLKIDGMDDLTNIDSYNINDAKVIERVRALKFDEAGNPLCATVDVAWDDENAPYDASKNFGTFNSYQLINTQLCERFGEDYYVKFFQYDWRLSNEENAHKLHQYVENMNFKRIVIVAHSMGGLVASNYINLGDYQRNKVQHLITLGTPFCGSLDIIQIFHIFYMARLGLYTISFVSGVFCIRLSNNTYVSIPHNPILRVLLKKLLKLVGCISIYIAEAIGDLIYNIPSVYELFPNKLYFSVAQKKYATFDGVFSDPITYDTYEKTRDFLAEYIDGFNLDLMHKAELVNDALYSNDNFITKLVDSYYIVGKDIATITELLYDENLLIDSIGWHEEKDGDGTVPKCSAALGELYPERVFYATGRSHTGNVDNIADEPGLLVSDNVIDKVSDIINNKPYNVIEGID